MATVKLRSHYVPHARVQEKGELLDHATGKVTRPPTMAKQEFRNECDINNILKQFSATGMLNHVALNAASGVYTDLPEPEEFQDSLHQVEEARRSFASLPSRVRARFDNEPVQFLEFMADPANLDEMKAMGLLVPDKVEPPPQKVEIVNPSPVDKPEKSTPS